MVRAADIDPGTSGASQPQLAVDATGNALAVGSAGHLAIPGSDLWTNLLK